MCMIFKIKGYNKAMKKDEFKEVAMELFVEWQKYHQAQDKSNKRFDDLKFWRGVLVGVVLAMVGWIATNYANEKPILIIIGIGIFIIAAIFTIALNSAISHRIDKIKGV